MTYIMPVHEQHYPSLLLPNRMQQYVSETAPPTMNRASAVMVSPQQVYDAVVKVQQRLSKFEIHPRYFVGTCYHEAGCTNEVDTEVANANAPTGFVTVGAWQISEEEANRYGYKLVDMLDLDKAADCMVRLAGDNLAGIIHVANTYCHDSKPFNPDYTDEHGTVWKDGALRAYLAICHNHGGGYTRITIQNYGLDWPAYKQRNPHDNIVAHAYGEDCVTGGIWYNKVVEA